jgi:hypothetical protein
MPNADSGSSSFGGSGYRDQRLSDFPLSSSSATSIAATDQESVLDFMEQLAILTELTSRRHERDVLLTIIQGRPIDTITAYPNQAVRTMRPTSSIRWEPRKPVITVASALPKTIYNEQNETNGGERAPEYVGVQRALLQYMETRASDTLSPYQAWEWTQAIAPTGENRPKAAEALRLCYYMRSQGYDVYAAIDGEDVLLYVVPQQGPPILYWTQSIVTNAVVEMGYPTPRTSRRNAVVDVDLFEEAQAESVLPQTAGVDELTAAQARVQVMLEDPRANPE